MKAVVLAAGIGSRLRPWTLAIPKALLPIGPDGQSILGRLLAQCADCGIDEAIVVTGHRDTAVRAHVADAPLPVRTLFNPDYDTMNNGQSLFVARDLVGGDAFVKFDGDLVLHEDLLPRLLAPAAGSHTLLDDGRDLTAEDMKAEVDPDRATVTALGKGLPLGAAGISIGAERIDAADSGLVFDALEQMIHVEGRTDGFYEDAYDAAFGRGFALGAVRTDGLYWTEIDTPGELEAARAAMSPAR